MAKSTSPKKPTPKKSEPEQTLCTHSKDGYPCKYLLGHEGPHEANQSPGTVLNGE